MGECKSQGHVDRDFSVVQGSLSSVCTHRPAMEDPWASGPSWSTPVKASTSALPSPEVRTSSPSHEAELDVCDPWGAPAPPQRATTLKASPVLDQPTEMHKAWGDDSGLGGWGIDGSEEVQPKPPEEGAAPSPRPEEDLGGVWNLDTPQMASTTFPLPDGSSPLPSPSSSPRRSASLPDLSSLDEAVRQSNPAYDDVASIEYMPKSPSFGEDGFGGFSTGLSSADPWGGGGFSAAKDEWDDGSRRGSSFAEPMQEDEQADGQGWGGNRQERVSSAPVKAREEDDWEEAQRRIKLRQERAVGLR